MEKQEKNTRQAASHGSYATYVSGFVLSIIFTLSAYFAVLYDWFSGSGLIVFILALAVVQMFIQLVFFLHLNREQRPRWNSITLVFASVVVLVLVIGSLWIMYNLNYNMTGHDVDQYIMEEEGVHR